MTNYDEFLGYDDLTIRPAEKSDCDALENIQTNSSYESSDNKLICKFTGRPCVARVIELRDGSHPMHNTRYFAQIREESLHYCPIRSLSAQGRKELIKVIKEDGLRQEKAGLEKDLERIQSRLKNISSQ